MKWNPLWKHCSDEKYGKRIKHPDFQGDDQKMGGWIRPLSLYEIQKHEKQKMGSTGLDLIKILKDNNGKLPDDFNISEYQTIFEQSKEETDDVTTQEISSTKKRRKVSNIPNTPENRYMKDNPNYRWKQCEPTTYEEHRDDPSYDPKKDKGENIDKVWEMMIKTKRIADDEIDPDDEDGWDNVESELSEFFINDDGEFVIKVDNSLSYVIRLKEDSVPIVYLWKAPFKKKRKKIQKGKALILKIGVDDTDGVAIKLVDKEAKKPIDDEDFMYKWVHELDEFVERMSVKDYNSELLDNQDDYWVDFSGYTCFDGKNFDLNLSKYGDQLIGCSVELIKGVPYVYLCRNNKKILQKGATFLVRIDKTNKYDKQFKLVDYNILKPKDDESYFYKWIEETDILKNKK